MNKSLLFLLAPILLSGVCRAEDKPVPEKPTTVRFLCASADIPSRFNRLPNGFCVPIPFSFDEHPPGVLCLKEGESYKPVPFIPSGVSQPLRLSDKKQGAPGGFYFEGAAGTETAASVLAQMGGTQSGKTPAPTPDSGKVEKNAKTWHLLAECPKADGRDHLICIFNPNTKAKWYPAKTLDLDISEKVFAVGQCMTINLSAKPVYVQAGEKSKPVALAAGGSFAISNIAPDENGEIRIKVAAVTAPGKTSIVFNRSIPVVAGKRSLIALHEAHPTASIPVEVRFHQIDNSVPKETSPDPKTTVGRR